MWEMGGETTFVKNMKNVHIEWAHINGGLTILQTVGFI